MDFAFGPTSFDQASFIDSPSTEALPNREIERWHLADIEGTESIDLEYAHGAQTLPEDCPYDVSRSRMRSRGAWSHGKASVIWREIDSEVGFAVTPNDTQIRLPCRMMTTQ